MIGKHKTESVGDIDEGDLPDAKRSCGTTQCFRLVVSVGAQAFAQRRWSGNSIHIHKFIGIEEQPAELWQSLLIH